MSEIFLSPVSGDRCVSAPAVSSPVWKRRPVGELDGHRSGRRRLHVGGVGLHSKCVRDVDHLLLRQFPVLLPAAGADEGGRTLVLCDASFLSWPRLRSSNPLPAAGRQLFFKL